MYVNFRIFQKKKVCDFFAVLNVIKMGTKKKKRIDNFLDEYQNSIVSIILLRPYIKPQ